MLLQSYKIIFAVMYRVKPCVHGASGASTYGLGGSGLVGSLLCEFCIAVNTIFKLLIYIHEVE